MKDDLTGEREDKSEGRETGFMESLLAYTLLSWLLATFPALMIIPNVYRGGSGSDEATATKVQIILIGFCSVYGAIGGVMIGLLEAILRRKDRMLPSFLAPIFGLIWGIVIGTIAGFPLFFIGGIFLGWMIAVPLGIVGFTLFAIIYEWLAARRQLRWWQIVLIALGVVSAVLGGIAVWFGTGNPAA